MVLRELVRDYPERTELIAQLVAHEREGDRIAHDIIHRLSRGLAKEPFEIDDGYRLATALDDIVDDAEAAADMLVVYRVEATTDQANQLAEILVGCGEQLALAIGALRAGRDLSPSWSRSTGWRTRPTGSAATRSPRSSKRASTRCS